jgi:hypothetical protein
LVVDFRFRRPLSSPNQQSAKINGELLQSLYKKQGNPLLSFNIADNNSFTEY